MKNYCDILVVSCPSRSSTAAFAFEVALTSPVLLIAFEREMPSVSPARYYKGLLRLSIDISVLCFLLSLVSALVVSI